MVVSRNFWPLSTVLSLNDALMIRLLSSKSRLQRLRLKFSFYFDVEDQFLVRNVTSKFEFSSKLPSPIFVLPSATAIYQFAF